VTRPAWTRRDERGNLAALRLMTRLSLRVGRRASRLLLAPACAYFVLFAPDARRASHAYLSRVLGRRTGWRDVWRHFMTFATTIHDRIYLLNERFDLFDLKLHGKEQVRDALADGHGAFLIGAHLGSFEVIRAIGRLRPDMRVAITMYEDNVQRIRSILATINPVVQQDVIALGQIDSMLKVRAYLDTGSLIGMLADRTVRDDTRDAQREYGFLGAPAAFALGPLHMAAMLRRPVIFMTGLHRGGNRYDIHFELLADFSQLARDARAAEVEAALARYVARLEHYCRAAPYNWFNFYDFWQAGPAAGEPTPAPRAAAGLTTPSRPS
jgi:predicted LPLAT superfamily acyltransferase